MVTPIGLAGSSRPQPRSVQAPKFGSTPPTPHAINGMTQKLKIRVNQLSNELSKKTGLVPPDRTPEQEAAFQETLKSAATSILKKQNSTPKQAPDAFFTDKNGLNHRAVPEPATGDEQKRFFESVAQNVFNQKVKPTFDREAQRQQEAYQNTYSYKLGQKAQSPDRSALNGIAGIASCLAPLPTQAATSTQRTSGTAGQIATPPASQATGSPSRTTETTQPNPTTSSETGSCCVGAAHDHQDSATASVAAAGEQAAASAPPQEEGTPVADGASVAAAGEQAAASAPPQEGETPVTDGTSLTSGEQAVAGAAGPKAADGETKTDTKKPETEKKETNATQKEEQNWKNGYIGWKVDIGAALVACGIALKMTIIGIVPGLIMAGVGAALMGWGGINWLSKDKK